MGYGGEQPPPGAPQGTNGFAIASLITGIIAPCGAGLLSIIFGIVALVQLKTRPQKGKGLAIGGLTATGVWIVVLSIVGIVAALNAPDDPTDPLTLPTPTTEATADPTEAPSDPAPEPTETSGGGATDVLIDELEVGMCVNGLEEGDAGLTLPLVPCGEPHQGEVYALYNVADGDYPGQEALFADADDQCLSRLQDASQDAYDDPDTQYFYYTPSEDTWAAGDREVICLTYYEEPRSGSIFD